MTDMYWLIKASVNVSILNDFVMLFETLPISGTGKYLHTGNCLPAKLPTPGKLLPEKLFPEKTAPENCPPENYPPEHCSLWKVLRRIFPT